ncbi:MAG: tRNA (guanosine(37)-N1)-methyltransferase TrmD [Candidatus Marinimicrobia bacterium]|nr:tRNA (guanosine(37)-N1)-methyltransferase TrmD [Candidatus Neomarinimicrobiota bacterium]
MSVHLLTPFPDMVNAIINESILKIAEKKEMVKYTVHNLFSYADPPHHRIDDYPFGGGSGMIMKPEPLSRAIEESTKDVNPGDRVRVIFPTPDGKVLSHATSEELSKADRLIFINGHYKGIDQRIRDRYVTDEISIGDYVLTGGELPTMVILDTVIRLIPGVLNTYESAETDSFANELLDFAHYTRPEEFDGMIVPEILLSGHHQKIATWRLDNQLEKTKKNRPDLFKKYLEPKEESE